MKLVHYAFALVIILSMALYGTIEYYEYRLIKEKLGVRDGIKTKYTSEEIDKMIKKLPNYQNDTLNIYDDGTIKSSNRDLDGGLNHAFNDSEIRDYMEQTALNERLPLAFVAYRLVVPYYLKEHKQKNLAKKVRK